MPLDITLVDQTTLLPVIRVGQAYLHTVTCAVLIGDDILILIRNDGSNELIGGHLEEFDNFSAWSAWNAVCREVNEETGLVDSLGLTFSNFTLKAISHYGRNMEKTNWIFVCHLPIQLPIEQVAHHLDANEHKGCFWTSLMHAKSGILVNGVNKHHEILLAIS